MPLLSKLFNKDILFILSVVFLMFLGIFVLNAIAPSIFPAYYGFYVIGFLAFIFFASIDFEILKIYSKHLYVFSLVLLLIVLFIGQVTRGTVRWIPIGSLSFQPSEIVRPFILLFFASFLGDGEIDIKHMIRSVLLAGIPVLLILIQPSFGVSVLVTVGLFGVLIAKDFDKRHLITIFLVAIALLPVFWLILRPYQKERIVGFFGQDDPRGASYNSIQSMIAVGSGKLLGRSLGKGVQTQLEFLPEKQTDFVFAAISEEMGFAGSLLTLGLTFTLFWRISYFLENSVSSTARAYISGFFLTFFLQIIIHVGMNMGLLPVTGVPYPLVSAGGSSFLGTMIGLGIVYTSYRKTNVSFL